MARGAGGGGGLVWLLITQRPAVEPSNSGGQRKVLSSFAQTDWREEGAVGNPTQSAKLNHVAGESRPPLNMQCTQQNDTHHNHLTGGTTMRQPLHGDTKHHDDSTLSDFNYATEILASSLRLTRVERIFKPRQNSYRHRVRYLPLSMYTPRHPNVRYISTDDIFVCLCCCGALIPRQGEARPASGSKLPPAPPACADPQKCCPPTCLAGPSPPIET